MGFLLSDYLPEPNRASTERKPASGIPHSKEANFLFFALSYLFSLKISYIDIIKVFTKQVNSNMKRHGQPRLFIILINYNFSLFFTKLRFVYRKKQQESFFKKSYTNIHFYGIIFI